MACFPPPPTHPPPLPTHSWGDGKASNPTTAGVDAHWAGAIVYDFLKAAFKRRSLDARGGAIVIAVHIPNRDGTGMDNAYFDPSEGKMFIGDGSNSGQQCPTKPGGRGAGQLLQADIEVRV